MLGLARAPGALTFPDAGESTVMEVHFVDDPLDLVDRWSVQQCSCWANFKISGERSDESDRKPQWPLPRLSGFGLAVKIFPEQNTRITIRF